jgi:hypothetical protein
MAWFFGGWIVLSIAAAALFYRLRSRYAPVSIPPQVQRFVRRLEEELRTNHPDVAICGMVPGRFAIVLRIDGQETPLGLHELFRHSLAFPDAFPQAVERFVREAATEGLDRPHDHGFADVATNLLPQIRSLEWVRSAAPALGDASLVHRPFGEDLAICYVIDEPWSMVFVCAAHLRQWGRSEEDLFRLATQNLQRLAGAPPVPGREEEPVIVHSGDGYDAARLLMLDPDKVEGLLVAMPQRDVLWLGNEDSVQIENLMALNEEQSRSAEHPVSPHLYRMQSGRPVQVTAAGPMP